MAKITNDSRYLHNNEDGGSGLSFGGVEFPEGVTLPPQSSGVTPSRSKSPKSKGKTSGRRLNYDKVFFTFLYLGIFVWFILFLLFSRFLQGLNGGQGLGGSNVIEPSSSSIIIESSSSEVDEYSDSDWSNSYTPLEGYEDSSNDGSLVWNDFRGTYTDYATYEADLNYYNSSISNSTAGE